MADETPQALELQLEDDLRSLGPRLEDERLVRDLYDALTRTRWSRHDRRGAVSLSFGRAEQLLNGLREEREEEPLPLGSSGGEGEIARRVADVADELGWRIDELDTGRRDDAHLAREGRTPGTEPQDTLAEGHREADEHPPVPKQGTPGR